MEGFAWFSHKFIMHGIMWRWHQSHHTPGNNLFEKNDLFGVFFAIISISFIVIGNTFTSASFLFYIGIGILLYGIFYFIFHEIVVHKRIKNKFKTQNKYLKRIIKAHHIHHKTFTQKGAEAFGFLYAQKKFESKN